MLKQHYDTSINYNFKENDLIEALLIDKIYTGRVKNRAPFNLEFPK